jgi:hypothetical protein
MLTTATAAMASVYVLSRMLCSLQKVATRSQTIRHNEPLKSSERWRS